MSDNIAPPTITTDQGTVITDPISYSICDASEQVLYCWLLDHGHTEPFYTTEELQEYFSVQHFAMPFVFVIRRSDNKRGLITWADASAENVMPDLKIYARLYFGWEDYDWSKPSRYA